MGIKSFFYCNFHPFIFSYFANWKTFTEYNIITRTVVNVARKFQKHAQKKCVAHVLKKERKKNHLDSSDEKKRHNDKITKVRGSVKFFPSFFLLVKRENRGIREWERELKKKKELILTIIWKVYKTPVS